eukprot:CAMPEP_0202884082 /NCGR_PEP_ID=MMETSP1391-20130828/40408_1 /ASSEMBLY_ACC=CAM_ASM_000867 /TAXON_ID=1034604 /ORGANISM="Chlamydomonas leiostraca, Strain SAG 11-49" /LENGTH=49 /DNA_ID= /DNA_START= /DNA_END= /DNA_ORIENTATION=
MASHMSDLGMAASTLSIQNMMQLCKDLRLPVNYKVNEVVEAESAGGQGQ